ncbi:hypothetical protein GOPIP_084_00080 [Gordonia polyisoprenivorans NBRC 16320 = JCM 10675]|uniref:hypothetical protein n=1 Tax=Gordonia polyisoprenivorans TaxID=84595 RepID=UPI00023A8610|nr:hypothetical protein [Gordonia polyisoprenivorans]GAB25425.1 hypothetical protein GOPIP_084_00080 [Gordonia polyisoprenivorans NBRC 16320 = JCM 10675]
MATTLPALATDSDTVETATTEPVTSRTGPDTDTESSADENTTARADSESVIDDDDPVGDETSSATDEDGPPDGGSDDESNEGESAESAEATESDSATHGSRRAVYFVGSLVIAIAAITAAVLLGRSYMADNAATARDNEITAAATQEVANLVTLRYGSADADVQRIRDGATGEFLNQIGDSTGGFAAVLKQGQVDSTGEASAISILSSSDDTATVIAAVTSQVKNSEAPEGQPRVYRMKLQLAHVGDRWLVSDVEFVS